MLKKFIGTKQFYKTVIAISLPIMIQNGITNFVNMLDNVMIGSVGTVEMTGVAIANQIIFVFNLAVFGALAGAGIFGAQYHGNGDAEGVRNTFRFKMIISFVIVAMGVALMLIFGRDLISLYLKGEGNAENAAASLEFGYAYMKIMLIGFLPYAISQAYASTLRETGETVLPMLSGLCAVFVNLILNYILIFGNFGAPALGIKGAAIATVASRFVELAIVTIRTHAKKDKYLFAIGLYKTFKVPDVLAKDILKHGMPLLLNEVMWAMGIALINQSYSIRGYDVVAATNISSTFWNVMSVVFMSLGTTVGIIIGHHLGAGEVEQAKDSDRKLIAFSVATAAVVGIVFASLSSVFPLLYNTTDEIRAMASKFIIACAVFMPVVSFGHATYFTLRAGGKTWITILFDSVFVWAINLPLAFCLSRFTSMPIVPLYTCCQAIDIIKCIIGYIFVKKGIWINNVVGKDLTSAAKPADENTKE